jgi:membrane-associated phospholipid phosphatase
MTLTASFAHRRASALAFALVAAASPLRAQSDSARSDTAQRDTAAAGRGPLLTRRDLVLGGVMLAGTFALMPADRAIRDGFQRSSVQSSGALRSTATVFRNLGHPGALLIGAGTYAFGRVWHHPTAADIGLHTTEAVLLAAGTTHLLKGIVGRERPYYDPTGPHDFLPFRGFFSHPRSAFPSGHTSAAFAFATSLTEETAHRWPHAVKWVAPTGYAAATLVGLSRIYNDEHWASDVIMGAAVGTLSGFATVRYMHTHPGNRLDRWLLHVSVAPGAGGAQVVWSLR